VELGLRTTGPNKPLANIGCAARPAADLKSFVAGEPLSSVAAGSFYLYFPRFWVEWILDTPNDLEGGNPSGNIHHYLKTLSFLITVWLRGKFNQIIGAKMVR